MAASKQASIHTHVRKAVTLVWGSLKLTPIRQPVSGKGEKWGKAEETRRKLPPCWFYTISLYYQSKLCNHGNHFVVKTTDLFYSDAHAVNVNYAITVTTLWLKQLIYFTVMHMQSMQTLNSSSLDWSKIW